MSFTIELEREADGRWITEVPQLPGTLAYGASRDEAVSKAKALALRVVADRLEHGEAAADLGDITFAGPPPSRSEGGPSGPDAPRC